MVQWSLAKDAIAEESSSPAMRLLDPQEKCSSNELETIAHYTNIIPLLVERKSHVISQEAFKGAAYLQ
jgi:hypothetical protein